MCKDPETGGVAGVFEDQQRSRVVGAEQVRCEC